MNLFMWWPPFWAPRAAPAGPERGPRRPRVGSAPCVGALMGPPAQVAKRKVLPMVFKVSQGRRPEGGGAARAVLGARRSGPGRPKSR